MKTWIKILITAVIALIITCLATANAYQHRANKQLRVQVKEQSKVIDSLLARRMTFFDCQLYVTDKSRNYVYGRYNRGTINMPQERLYRLVIDSVKMTVK